MLKKADNRRAALEIRACQVAVVDREGRSNPVFEVPRRRIDPNHVSRLDE